MSQTTESINTHIVSDSPVEPQTVAPSPMESSIGVMAGGQVSSTSVKQTGSLYQLDSMPDGDYNSFFERQVQIATGNFSSSDVANSTTALGDLIQTWLTTATVSRKLANFQYCSFTFRMRINVSLPRGCGGIYVLTAYPDAGTPSSAGMSVAQIPNYTTCMQAQHVMFNLESGNSAELELPWMWPFDVSTPAGLLNMYQFRLICLAPLDNGVGTTTVGSYTIYGSAVNMRLVAPAYQGKKLAEHMGKHGDAINDKVKSLTGGKKASEVAGKIAGVATTVAGMVPFLAPLAGPVAGAAAAASGFLDMLGFTKETAPMAQTTVVSRNHTNTANIDGEDRSEVCALLASNSISIDPRIGGRADGDDPMSFAHLMSHWTVIESFNWSSTSAAGTNLMSIPVTPFYGVTSGTTQVFWPMPAAYIGIPFQYWRGDMEYRILISASSFHRGALQVSWTAGPTASGDVTGVLQNHIFDLEGGREHRFEVGYSRDYPMLETGFESAVYPFIKRPTANWNGALTFTVIRPVESQLSTSTVRVVVLARAAANMRFAVPKTVEVVWSADGIAANVAQPFMSTYVVQGRLADEDEVVGEDEISQPLVPLSGTYPLAEVLVGEEIASTRALVQKFNQMSMLTSTAATDAISRRFMQHFPAPPCSNQVNSFNPHSVSAAINFTFVGWLRVLFTGIAGSTRYKIMNTAPEATTSVQSVMYAGAEAVPYAEGACDLYTGVTAMQPAMVNNGWMIMQGQTAEIMVPYYSKKKFELGRAVADPISAATTERVDAIVTARVYTVSTSPPYVLYVAAGPDFRVTNFRCVPAVQMVTTGNNPGRAWVQ